MLPPSSNGLLSPLQKAFLRLFSALKDQENFYLTGGTALAEFYFGHRFSYDLDFFTGIDRLVLPVSYQIEETAPNHGIQAQVIRRFATYVEFLLQSEGEELKIDLALDSPFRFAPPLLSDDGVWINNFKDLCVDKLLAYYGRAEPRDAVDLYFILQNQPIDQLMQKAALKDPGFDVYWFTIALKRCAAFPDEIERWPVKMILPFDPIKLKADFNDLALRLIDQLNRPASPH